ncbi:MAG: Nitrate reductase [Dehalococcoidia bacterium]|nr:Nitrate reductase [Dehalococcoidia bacterium]
MELPTICAFCSTSCGLLMTVENNRIQRVRGNPDHPTNSGGICPKGAALKQVVHSPERLKTPLVRTEHGFKPVSWSEALDFIAGRLADIREKYGPQTLISCRGAPVGQETFDAFHQLLHAYGSPNITGSGHLCSVPRRIAIEQVTGRRPEPDYEGSRLVIIWAANPTDSYRLAEGTAYGSHPDSSGLPRAREAGTRLVVIDPRRTQAAAQADKWLRMNPGTDAALMMAMLHTIIQEKLYDGDFVRQWTAGFDELAERVSGARPEWAAELTGIPSDDIRELAYLYASSKPAAIRDGNGLDMHLNVSGTTRLLASLEAITGNLDIPGGNVFYPQPRLSRYPILESPGKRLGEERYPLFPYAPFPVVADALLSDEPGRPRAMLVYHANPLLVNAGESKVRRALSRLDLLVVDELFMTATAQMAHIVLPGASDVEQASLRAYSSRQGGFIALRRRLIEPPGEARPVMEVEYEIALRLGLAGAYPWRTTEEWIDYRLKDSGTSRAEMEQRTVAYTTPSLEYRKYLKRGFNTPSGKVELSSARLEKMGKDPLPDYVEPVSRLRYPELVARFPLVGTTQRPGNYVHTRFRNIGTLRHMRPRALVTIHPLDAGSRGIAGGEQVRVTSPEGEIEFTARVSSEIGPGVVVMDFGWGNPGDNGPNVNALASDEPRDPFFASTSNRAFLCQVRKA